jgi:hypothetical protein
MLSAQHRDSCLDRELYRTALYCQGIENGIGQGVGVSEDRAVGGVLLLCRHQRVRWLRLPPQTD